MTLTGEHLADLIVALLKRGSRRWRPAPQRWRRLPAGQSPATSKSPDEPAGWTGLAIFSFGLMWLAMAIWERW